MAENTEPNQYTSVYTAFGQLAGEMVRLLLEAHGIPAILSQESAGLAMGLTIGRLGEVKILVPTERVEDAQRIIRDMEEGRLDVDPRTDLSADHPRYKNNKFTQDEIYKAQD